LDDVVLVVSGSVPVKRLAMPAKLLVARGQLGGVQRQRAILLEGNADVGELLMPLPSTVETWCCASGS
jgi:hypothetical protein